MTYQATVINVMIASPSDVDIERRQIREILEGWNAAHAQHRKQILIGLGWDTHASPELGGRPQGIINKQILGDCDLLIAAFWTRIGSPTGKAPSGTVEEVEEHLKLGKPAMLYFSRAPVHLDSVDRNQYSMLQEFKETFRKRGLIEEYETISQFRDKLTRQLAQTVYRKFPVPDQTKSSHQDVPRFLSPSDLPRFPALSESATELLLAACEDESGVLMCMEVVGGFIVQAGSRDFMSASNREFARWKAAIEELKRKGLIRDQGFKDEIFVVTDLGYRTADHLTKK